MDLGYVSFLLSKWIFRGGGFSGPSYRDFPTKIEKNSRTVKGYIS